MPVGASAAHWQWQRRELRVAADHGACTRFLASQRAGSLSLAVGGEVARTEEGELASLPASSSARRPGDETRPVCTVQFTSSEHAGVGRDSVGSRSCSAGTAGATNEGGCEMNKRTLTLRCAQRAPTDPRQRTSVWTKVLEFEYHASLQQATTLQWGEQRRSFQRFHNCAQLFRIRTSHSK